MIGKVSGQTSGLTWDEVSSHIAALCQGEGDIIAKMATIACELFHAFDHYDWVGFYRVVGPKLLKIGPYQGDHGCLTISFSRGVCGACAREEKTIIVPDINAIPDHIACSSTTRSEIVVPVFGNGQLIAVLDVDSNMPDAFDDEDKVRLEKILGDSF